MRQKLKPCPFCGEEPTLHESHFLMWIAQCGNCGATRMGLTAGEAIESWNRRVNDEEAEV